MKALVSLPDFPVGTLRDVDPNDERIQGYLRAAFIVPMIRRPEAKPEPKIPKKTGE